MRKETLPESLRQVSAADVNDETHEQRLAEALRIFHERKEALERDWTPSVPESSAKSISQEIVSSSTNSVPSPHGISTLSIRKHTQ